MTATTIPILPSADFDATTAFWRAYGFAETGRWPNEYLILVNSDIGIEFHFWPNPNVSRWTNDVGCYVRFASVAAATACHEAWAVVPLVEPASFGALDEGPAGPGSVEFHVIDVHGNLVRLGGFAG